jgi:chitinase
VFKQDIANLRAQGKIVNISLGGAEGTINMSSLTHENAFVAHMTEIITEWGFNGIDIDYESASGIAQTMESRLAETRKRWAMASSSL